MQLAEFKEAIINNELANLYVFVGEEIGIMNIYLEQLSSRKSLDILREETVSGAVMRAESVGFFASEPALYVVRGDKDFQKEESAWDIQLDGSILVVMYDKLDSRLKFTKHFKDRAVIFEKLSDGVLARYISEKTGLSERYSHILAEVCDHSYDVAMLESDKLLDYMQASSLKDVNRALKTLVENGTIYQSDATDVFAFTDAVCRRDREDAFLMAKTLVENGTSSINILGTLYNSLKAIMLIQCCSGDIAQITGLDNGAIYYNKKRTGYYDVLELVNAIKLIAKTVENIKSGKIEDILATDFVLCNIL